MELVHCHIGQLALQIQELFNAKDLRSRTLLIVNSFVLHWKQHLRSTISGLKESYQVGLETGDVEYSARSAFALCGYLYWLGHELSDLEKILYDYGETITQSKQNNTLICLNINRQAVLNLLGESPNPSVLDGSSLCSRSECDPTSGRQSHRTVLFLCPPDVFKLLVW